MSIATFDTFLHTDASPVTCCGCGDAPPAVFTFVCATGDHWQALCSDCLRTLADTLDLDGKPLDS